MVSCYRSLHNTVFKDLCLWLCISIPWRMSNTLSFPRGEKSSFPLALYNHKPWCNAPVNPLPITLHQHFSGTDTQEENAQSFIADRFIHHLMEYCKVTLQKVCSSLFLSRAWCSVECSNSIHLWGGSVIFFFPFRHSYSSPPINLSSQFNKSRLRRVPWFPHVVESECKSKHLAINLKHTLHHTILQIHSPHKYSVPLYCMPVLGADGPWHMVWPLTLNKYESNSIK